MRSASRSGRSAATLRSRRDSQPRTVLWVIYGLFGVLLVGYLFSLILRGDNQYWPWLDGWLVCGVELVASALCITRGLLRASGSRAWPLALGASLLSWSIGDVVLSVQSARRGDPSDTFAGRRLLPGLLPLLLRRRGDVHAGRGEKAHHPELARRRHSRSRGGGSLCSLRLPQHREDRPAATRQQRSPAWPTRSETSCSSA